MRRMIAGGLLVVLLTSLGPGPLAAQYTDPGASSILIQALLGGLVGFAAVVKIYWGKIKAFTQRPKKATGDGS